MEWKKVFVKSKELQLLGTLNGGQSFRYIKLLYILYIAFVIAFYTTLYVLVLFRWKKITENETETWLGVFSGKVWKLQQKDDCILYKVYEKSNNDEPPSKKTKESSHEDILKQYFHLDLNLEEYYTQWSKADEYFKQAAQQFYGIRILQQQPIENIFSFICSANNHISRITSMVEKLAIYYGEEICEVDGKIYHSFPTIDQLNVEGVEQKLKENGFGYRAKYISKTAQMIKENGGDDWVESLKKLSYADAKKELMKLTGIGAKVRHVFITY